MKGSPRPGQYPHERSWSLFDEMLDGFALHEIICDADGMPVDYRFLAANPSFERMTDLKAADIVGKTVLEVMPDTELRWIEVYGRVARTGESVQFEDYSGALGMHFEVKAFCPGPGQFACIFADITERVRATDALRHSEIRLHMAQEAASAGSWEWDVHSGLSSWSDQLWDLFDVERDSVEPSYDAWLETILPADRQRVECATTEVLRTGADLEVEWRVNMRDASERWLLLRARPALDSHDRLVLYVGIAIDVTADRRIRDQLTWTRRKLEEAHRIARIGVWDWVEATDTMTWSRELNQILDRDPGLLAPGFAEQSGFYSADSWETLSAVVTVALDTGQPYDVELAMIRPDGAIRWTRTVGSIMSDRDGAILGLHGIVHDITERKLVEQELAHHRRRLAELAADILTSCESDRRRIAVQLHEGVGQTLAAAKMIARQMHVSADDGETAEDVRRFVGLLNDSIVGIRQLTVELSPPVLYELGLGPALGWLADNCLERYGLKCDIQIDSLHSGLKTHRMTVLFRAVRELLSNVGQHAGVSRANVSATCRDDMVVVCVEDEGCGFDLMSLSAISAGGAHFGLLSIREEIGLAGGTVEIDTCSGRGTRVDIRLPVYTDVDQLTEQEDVFRNQLVAE